MNQNKINCNSSPKIAYNLCFADFQKILEDNFKKRFIIFPLFVSMFLSKMIVKSDLHIIYYFSIDIKSTNHQAYCLSL